MGWKSLEQRRQYLARPEVKDRVKELATIRRNKPENKEYMKKYSHNRYIAQRSEYLERAKKWAQKNPEKRLKITIKNHSKGATQFKITVRQYKHALQAWSKLVKSRDNQKCIICGNKADEAHHIFYKANYPELSLNINNGISLCLEHHHEIHGACLS